MTDGTGVGGCLLLQDAVSPAAQWAVETSMLRQMYPHAQMVLVVSSPASGYAASGPSVIA